MSFSEDTKEEICSVKPKAPCCRLSMLYGMYFGGFRAEGRKEVPETVLITAARLEKAADGIDLFSVAEHDEIQPVMECRECSWEFVKGVFTVCGTVSDPEKSYHLEFDFPSATRAESFAAHLTSLGFTPGIIKRYGETHGVYFKDSEKIVDILGHLGASRSTFGLLDSKMMSEISNDANRASNCDAANIKRTVTAASAQMRAIEKIAESGTADLLPPALKETFDLRAANPMASLSELAEMHCPPITRSGLNHRLKRIIEFAEDIGRK